MKKSAQVVMLPTNEKTNIWLDNFGTGLYNCPTGATGVIYQHLYILSDEEIKEGDYHVAIRIVKTNGDKAIAFTDQEQLDAIAEIGGAKKIIATTDKLNIHPNLADSYRSGNCLPQIPQSFIEYYVSEYNKGNQITDVMVEYEYRHDDSVPYPKTLDGKAVLKINLDNTINIKPIKDSWSREEVTTLLYSLNRDKEGNFDCTKWIEENL